MKKTIIIALLCVFWACEKNEENQSIEFIHIEREPITDTIFEIQADIETDPIQATPSSDAADDPAVWIHPDDPSKSIIYGSNKKGGIAAYNLSGAEIAYAELGQINNIDVAYNLRILNETIDVCGGTNRTTNAIELFKIHPETGELEYILDSSVISNVNEVYGFCFYNSPVTAKNYAILCGKDGIIEHYEVLEGMDKLGLKLVSSFDIGSQPEGLVADHKHGYLYIGEENKGIWKVNAEPGIHTPEKIALSSYDDNENIDYDIEGLTIYYTSSNYGYLIASSQGNNSFAIYDRFLKNAYIGSFRIIDGSIDGNSDTDGIDVVNLNLGPTFPNGMFIAQDGNNFDNGMRLPQNFKMLDWVKIATIFDPPLLIDSNFNVRSLFED